MTNTANSKTTSRRLVIGSIVGVLIVAAIVVAVVVIPKLASGLSLGQVMYEQQGVTASASYGSAAAVPAADKPDWLPSSATDIHTKVSGPHARQAGRKLLDAAVPTGFTLPPECRAGQPGFPWDDGWDNVDPRTALVCGPWTATIVDGRLYAWI